MQEREGDIPVDFFALRAIPGNLGKDRFGRVLVHHQRIGCKQAALSQQPEELERYRVCIRWVQIDEIEWALQAVEGPLGRRCENAQDVVDTEIAGARFDPRTEPSGAVPGDEQRPRERGSLDVLTQCGGRSGL